MNKRTAVRVTITILSAAAQLLGQNTAADEFFEKKIRPVLSKNCAGCHNAKLKTAGLDLTTAEGFVNGGQSGPAVSKENASSSLLLRVIGYEQQPKMPPTGKLKDEELADLKTWVQSGASWPGAAATTQALPKPANSREFTDAEKKFWAFQPVHKPAVPVTKDKKWAKTPIDNFILAKLEEEGLRPAPPAGKATLLRRITFDMTGLPPTESEIRDFLADSSPQAYEKVVDRLLASPRYGEQWGRHWLDVARYADSTGNDEDHRYPYAWRYRDYVIGAFNDDLPYDQFVREQLAGDLLPAAKPGEINRRGIVATGFLALGAKALAQKDTKKMFYDVYDEQVDTVSKAFMGVTLACARCHDHKFDPLLTKDYYSMVAIFANTRDFTAKGSKLLYKPLVPKEEVDRYSQYQEKVNTKTLEMEDVTDEQIEKYTSELVPHLAEYMVAARRVYVDGANLATVANEQSLREEILQRWVKYLQPNDKESAKPSLDGWKNAAPGAATETAKAYQARFETRRAEWALTMSKWRGRFRKMTAEKNMPPPAKPKFKAEKDPFFYEVYFQGPFSVSKEERAKIIPQETQARLVLLQKELKDLKDTMPPEPDMACAVEEGDSVEQNIFIRGDYNSPGQVAPKAFPLILTRYEQPAIQKGSGRLELAEWLTRPDNPLTARVMVNRIWQGHFADGIVRTPDNFGRMGDRPTHPELLDFLASRFVENGWSVKSIQRMILLSSAYQMSSDITDASLEADQDNSLLSRFPRRRLSVEEIRDGMLATDGTLDLTMGGTLQKGFGTDSENSNSRLSLRPEDISRRMVYLPLRRANLPTLLNLFDFGDATTPAGKRAMTTIAPQALFMMNSDFVAGRCKNISEQALKDSADASVRMRRLYMKILNREPAADDLDAGLTYVANFQKKFAGKRTEADAWFSFSRILIASNEFIYLD